jgi:hypothetical protein
MGIQTKMSRSFRLSVAFVLSCGIWQPAHAQERGHDFHEHEFRGPDAREHEFHDHAFREREYQDGRFLDPRYHHDHYYPPVGFVFGALPPGYRIIHRLDGDLSFAGGVWYRTAGPGRYVVVAPSIGVAVPVLPPSYTTVMVGGVPYYYANNTYYLGSSTGYVVVQPPPSNAVVELPPSPVAVQPAPPNTVIELPRN